MKTLSLRKQAALAPKYVLGVDGVDLYLSAKQSISGCNLTDEISEAQKFSVGFDDPAAKISIWNAELKRLYNLSTVTFKAVNI